MKKLSTILCCIFFLLLASLQSVSAKELQPKKLQSEYVYVYNLDEKKAVYEKSADEKIHPASMTKIMTVWVALEHISDEDEKILLKEKVFEGLEEEHASVAGFQPDEEVTLRDLLYGIMLPSGADAGRAIAMHIAGSEEAFVKLMNDKVRELDLSSTHFVNTSGLDDKDHYTTAREMATILEHAIQDERFLEIFTAKSYTSSPTIFHPSGIVMNSTVFQGVSRVQGDTSLIKGGKTGFTFDAGHCLASISQKMNGTSWLVVTANGPGSFYGTSHIEDALQIYSWLKDTYEYRLLYDKGTKLAEAQVQRMIGTTTLSYYAKEDVYGIVPKGEEVSISTQIEEGLKEPVKKGDRIGTIVLSSPSATVKELAFTSEETLFHTTFFFIGCAGVLLAAVILLFAIRQRNIRRLQKRRQQRMQHVQKMEGRLAASSAQRKERLVRKRRIKRERLLVLLAALILLVLLLVTAIRGLFRQVDLKLKEEASAIEYGAKGIDALSFVEEADGEVLSASAIDTGKAGKQTITYVVKKDGEEYRVEKEVTIKDTKQPEIKLKTELVTLTKGSSYRSAYNISSIKDPIDGELSYQKEQKENSYTIEGSFDTKQPGDYPMKVVATDKNGNTAEKTFTIRVENSPVAYDDQAKEVKEPTYIDGILLVNKLHGLPKDFGETNETAYASLQELQQGALKAGHEIPLLSGYRTYEYQVTLYDSYVQQDGKEAADRYSARPGYSEHQSGFCFDIGEISNSYGETAAGKWLEEHCADYGFIIRYPKGKEDITGYQYEPWHVRYVGKKASAVIMKDGITLEEYLGVR